MEEATLSADSPPRSGISSDHDSKGSVVTVSDVQGYRYWQQRGRLEVS